MKYDAVIVASGKGERANLGFNKAFFVMKNGLTVLENACSYFIKDDDCQKIIVVTNEKEKVFINKKIEIVNGGERRQDSVINGLNKVKSDYVLIHDAARPFVSGKDIENLKKEVEKHDAAILVSNTINTVKKVRNGIVENTVDRTTLYSALTPQAFKTEIIKESYIKYNNEMLTDDSQALEKNGYRVYVIIGEKTNIKLTENSDFDNI